VNVKGVKKMNVKNNKGIAIIILGSALLAGCAPTIAAASMKNGATEMNQADDQILLDLSRQKWVWMADRKTDLLDALFHADAVFVHMGATLSKSEELDVISTGKIHYKKTEIEDASVKLIGDTAILLNKLRLVAVVGGNEVTNPFVVTEVYVRQSDSWKLASMSFTRLLGE
jgi:ketosteroid isomerase-like protein